MNPFEVIQLARKHANNGAQMQSSAQLCLKDAIDLQQQGKCVAARNRSALVARVGLEPTTSGV